MATSPGVPLRRVIANTFRGAVAHHRGHRPVGVIAHDVSRRRPELALGADPRRLQRGVMMQGFALVFSGVASGAVLRFALSPGLRAVAYETSLGDLMTLVVAVLVPYSVAPLAPPPFRTACSQDEPIRRAQGD